MRWEAVATRAAGLMARRLDRRALDELAEAPDLPALAARLARAGIPVAEAGSSAPRAVPGASAAPARPTALGLELAVRRHAAHAIGTLARWLDVDGARDALAVFLDAEDLRSVRALIRGAVVGAPAESRLAGLVPTPGLPNRALELLAREPRPARIVALLVAWRHPFGAALAPVVSEGAEPDLFRVEAALVDAFARSATLGAARVGEPLTALVAEIVDASNLQAALRLAAEGHDVDAPRAFVEGGAVLDRAAFVAAASAAEASDASAILASACERRDRGLAAAVRGAAGDPVTLETALAARRARILRGRVVSAPIGPARVALFFLALRNEVRNLRALIWGIALGVPPEIRRAGLTEV
ncbi:MAG: V-type ATPase subunit [bacterium]